MNEALGDVLWPHFKPLWDSWLHDLPTAAPLVAGGYGLFLKQKWLLSDNGESRIVVPLTRWRNPTPRATKDFDLVIGLDLILDSDAQKLLVELLERNQFVVTTKNPRWQFEKSLGEERRVLVELHAAPPVGEHPEIRADRIRVKRRKSLHELGIHARSNPEAVGHELHPMSVSVDGTPIKVPNPVTWLIMKMTASADCHESSRDPERNAEFRDFSFRQSIKHANDAFRIAAMVTEAERDNALEVAGSIRGSEAFIRAAQIYNSDFSSDAGWAHAHLRNNWEEGDLPTIRALLAEWFP